MFSGSLAAIVALGLFLLRMRAGMVAPAGNQGPLHPVLTIVRARFGGTVRAVLAKTGERVEPGQVLIRFEAKELDDRLRQLRKAAQKATTAVKVRNAMAQIPNQLRQYLYELHPDIVRADLKYGEALGAFERAQDGYREAADVQLRRAAKERTRVRRELGQLFSANANSLDSRVYLAELAGGIKELENRLRDTEVRAPSGALIDLIDAHAGEEIQPGQPIAVLISEKEYLVELAVTEEAAKRLHQGMALKGRLDDGHSEVEARIEAITLRKIPVIARDNLRAADVSIVHARIVSATPLRGGAAATFLLP